MDTFKYLLDGDGDDDAGWSDPDVAADLDRGVVGVPLEEDEEDEEGDWETDEVLGDVLPGDPEKDEDEDGDDLPDPIADDELAMGNVFGED